MAASPFFRCQPRSRAEGATLGLDAGELPRPRRSPPTFTLMPLVRRGIRSELDLQLAEILATQQSDEGARRVLKTLDNILLVLEAAAAHPFTHLAERRTILGVEVKDDEATHRHAAPDKQAEQPRSKLGAGGIVLRDRAAQRHPRPEVEVEEDSITDGATDVVEIDIDTVRHAC